MQRLNVLVCILAAVSAPLAGQLNTLPVMVSPKGGTGFMLAVDYGRGLNTESGENSAVGARAALGLGPVSIGAGAGTVNPRISTVSSLRDTELQYMVNGAIRVLGGAFVPVAINIHGGAGFLNRTLDGAERKEINIPVGIGIGLNVPTPGFSFEPWVAPRFSVRRVEEGGVSDTQTGFGLSAGIGLGFAMGLGLHVALDWSDLSAATLLSPDDVIGIKPAVFGIGLNYTFRLPGLGVPVAPGI